MDTIEVEDERLLLDVERFAREVFRDDSVKDEVALVAASVLAQIHLAVTVTKMTDKLVTL